MPPFHEYSDLMTLAHILKGERPEKPDFDTTLGYTEELWEMTTSCWKEDPGDRPTVDCVLGTFKSAAERWETEHEEIDTPSPRHGWNSTPLTERLDSPTISEHEIEPATCTTASASPNYVESLVIE